MKPAMWIRIAKWAAPFALVAVATAVMMVMLLLRPGGGADVTLAAGTCTQDRPVDVDGPLSFSDVASLAQQAGFPADQIPVAVAVASAESSRNPAATNHNSNGTTDWGLFQINDVNASVLAGGDKFDPADNTAMAYAIWKQWGNWNAWVTFSTGSYRQFLPDADQVAYDLPGCTPQVTADCKGGTGTGGGYANGRIPRSALCPLWADGSKLLRADAAASFDALSRAYYGRFGSKPCVTDAYRSLAEQVDVRRRKPTLAAVPGTSNHGWGVAVDLGCGSQIAGSDVDAWLHANAGRFGWTHPAWAEPGGSKPEPWHWETAR